VISAVGAAYGVASFCAFVAYGMDKAAAKLGWRRIPERYLHLMGLACGWPGALLAQRVFRHKCSKRSFQGIFRATVAVNTAVAGCLWWAQQ